MTRLKTSDLIKPFKEAKKFWYIIPRAQYFNEENLKEFHDVLSFFKKYQFIKVKESKYHQSDLFQTLKPDDLVLRVWDQETQMTVQKEWIKNEIIRPFKSKKQSKNDQLANFRNHINLCKKLGFAHFNHLKHLYISAMGENFLNAPHEKWKEILEQQIRKIQFFNPSLKLADDNTDALNYKEYKVFPYFYVIRLLNLLSEKYLTVDEYILFVSYTKSDNEIESSNKLINAFRKLKKEQQQKLIKTAKITQPLKIQGSITLQLFGLTPTLKFYENKIELINQKRAEEQINKIYKTLKYIDYATFEDWFSYMGNIETEIEEKEILDYYVSVGKEDKAKEFIELEDDIQKKITLEEQLLKLMTEKFVEDLLEKDISLLGEDNLKLLKDGRQYKTDVSYIDLLCKDELGYVVLELKKGRTEDEAVGQVLRYMGWVRDNMSPNQKVRGIIVVAFEGITEKLEKAIRGIQRDDELIKLKHIDVDLSKSQVKNINIR